MLFKKVFCVVAFTIICYTRFVVSLDLVNVRKRHILRKREVPLSTETIRSKFNSQEGPHDQNTLQFLTSETKANGNEDLFSVTDSENTLGLYKRSISNPEESEVNDPLLRKDEVDHGRSFKRNYKDRKKRGFRRHNPFRKSGDRSDLTSHHHHHKPSSDEIKKKRSCHRKNVRVRGHLLRKRSSQTDEECGFPELDDVKAIQLEIHAINKSRGSLGSTRTSSTCGKCHRQPPRKWQGHTEKRLNEVNAMLFGVPQEEDVDDAATPDAVVCSEATQRSQPSSYNEFQPPSPPPRNIIQQPTFPLTCVAPPEALPEGQIDFMKSMEYAELPKLSEFAGSLNHKPQEYTGYVEKPQTQETSCSSKSIKLQEVSSISNRMQPQKQDFTGFSESIKPQPLKISSVSQPMQPQAQEVSGFSESMKTNSQKISSFSKPVQPQTQEVSVFSESMKPNSQEISSFSKPVQPQTQEVSGFSESMKPNSQEISSFSNPVQPQTQEVSGFSESMKPNSQENLSFSKPMQPQTQEVSGFSESQDSLSIPEPLSPPMPQDYSENSGSVFPAQNQEYQPLDGSYNLPPGDSDNQRSVNALGGKTNLLGIYSEAGHCFVPLKNYKDSDYSESQKLRTLDIRKFEDNSPFSFTSEESDPIQIPGPNLPMKQVNLSDDSRRLKEVKKSVDAQLSGSVVKCPCPENKDKSDEQAAVELTRKFINDVVSRSQYDVQTEFPDISNTKAGDPNGNCNTCTTTKPTCCPEPKPGNSCDNCGPPPNQASKLDVWTCSVQNGNIPLIMDDLNNEAAFDLMHYECHPESDNSRCRSENSKCPKRTMETCGTKCESKKQIKINEVEPKPDDQQSKTKEFKLISGQDSQLAPMEEVRQDGVNELNPIYIHMDRNLDPSGYRIIYPPDATHQQQATMQIPRPVSQQVPQTWHQEGPQILYQQHMSQNKPQGMLHELPQQEKLQTPQQIPQLVPVQEYLQYLQQMPQPVSKEEHHQMPELVPKQDYYQQHLQQIPQPVRKQEYHHKQISPEMLSRGSKVVREESPYLNDPITRILINLDVPLNNLMALNYTNATELTLKGNIQDDTQNLTKAKEVNDNLTKAPEGKDNLTKAQEEIYDQTKAPVGNNIQKKAQEEIYDQTRTQESNNNPTASVISASRVCPQIGDNVRKEPPEQPPCNLGVVFAEQVEKLPAKISASELKILNEFHPKPTGKSTFTYSLPPDAAVYPELFDYKVNLTAHVNDESPANATPRLNRELRHLSIDQITRRLKGEGYRKKQNVGEFSARSGKAVHYNEGLDTREDMVKYLASAHRRAANHAKESAESVFKVSDISNEKLDSVKEGYYQRKQPAEVTQEYMDKLADHRELVHYISPAPTHDEHHITARDVAQVHGHGKPNRHTIKEPASPPDMTTQCLTLRRRQAPYHFRHRLHLYVPPVAEDNKNMDMPFGPGADKVKEFIPIAPQPQTPEFDIFVPNVMQEDPSLVVTSLDDSPLVKPSFKHIPLVNPSIDESPVKTPPIDQGPEVKPSLVQSSQVKPSLVQSSQVKPSLDQSSQVKPSSDQSSQSKPSINQRPQVKPSIDQRPQVKPSIDQRPQVKPSIEQRPQVRPSMVHSPQVKPSIDQTPQVKTTYVNGPQVKVPNRQKQSHVADAHLEEGEDPALETFEPPFEETFEEDQNELEYMDSVVDLDLPPDEELDPPAQSELDEDVEDLPDMTTQSTPMDDIMWNPAKPMEMRQSAAANQRPVEKLNTESQDLGDALPGRMLDMLDTMNPPEHLPSDSEVQDLLADFPLAGEPEFTETKPQVKKLNEVVPLNPPHESDEQGLPSIEEIDAKIGPQFDEYNPFQPPVEAKAEDGLRPLASREILAHLKPPDGVNLNQQPEKTKEEEFEESFKRISENHPLGVSGQGNNFASDSLDRIKLPSNFQDEPLTLPEPQKITKSKPKLSPFPLVLKRISEAIVNCNHKKAPKPSELPYFFDAMKNVKKEISPKNSEIITKIASDQEQNILFPRDAEGIVHCSGALDEEYPDELAEGDIGTVFFAPSANDKKQDDVKEEVKPKVEDEKTKDVNEPIIVVVNDAMLKDHPLLLARAMQKLIDMDMTSGQLQNPPTASSCAPPRSKCKPSSISLDQSDVKSVEESPSRRLAEIPKRVVVVVDSGDYDERPGATTKRATDPPLRDCAGKSRPSRNMGFVDGIPWMLVPTNLTTTECNTEATEDLMWPEETQCITRRRKPCARTSACTHSTGKPCSKTSVRTTDKPCVQQTTKANDISTQIPDITQCAPLITKPSESPCPTPNDISTQIPDITQCAPLITKPSESPCPTPECTPTQTECTPTQTDCTPKCEEEGTENKVIEIELIKPVNATEIDYQDLLDQVVHGKMLQRVDNDYVFDEENCTTLQPRGRRHEWKRISNSPHGNGAQGLVDDYVVEVELEVITDRNPFASVANSSVLVRSTGLYDDFTFSGTRANATNFKPVFFGEVVPPTTAYTSNPSASYFLVNSTTFPAYSYQESITFNSPNVTSNSTPKSNAVSFDSFVFNPYSFSPTSESAPNYASAAFSPLNMTNSAIVSTIQEINSNSTSASFNSIPNSNTFTIENFFTPYSFIPASEPTSNNITASSFSPFINMTKSSIVDTIQKLDSDASNGLSYGNASTSTSYYNNGVSYNILASVQKPMEQGINNTALKNGSIQTTVSPFNEKMNSDKSVNVVIFLKPEEDGAQNASSFINSIIVSPQNATGVSINSFTDVRTNASGITNVLTALPQNVTGASIKSSTDVRTNASGIANVLTALPQNATGASMKSSTDVRTNASGITNVLTALPQNATGTSMKSSTDVRTNASGITNVLTSLPQNATGVSIKSSTDVRTNASGITNVLNALPQNVTGASIKSSTDVRTNASGIANVLTAALPQNVTGASTKSSTDVRTNANGVTNVSLVMQNATGELIKSSTYVRTNASGLINRLTKPLMAHNATGPLIKSSTDVRTNTNSLTNVSLVKPQNSTGATMKSSTYVRTNASGLNGLTKPMAQNATSASIKSSADVRTNASDFINVLTALPQNDTAASIKSSTDVRTNTSGLLNCIIMASNNTIESINCTANAPTNGSGSPKSVTNAPKNTTGLSNNSMNAPKNTTGSSNSSMNAPKNANGSSNSSMNAPKNATGWSNSSMNAPKNATGLSNSTMNAPKNATGSSNSSMNAPKNATGSSNSSMNAPKNATGLSNSSMNAPKNATGSSNSSMNAPKNATGSSNSSMNAPKNITGSSNSSMNAPKNATGLSNSSMNVPMNATRSSNSSINAPKNATGSSNSSINAPKNATGSSNSSMNAAKNATGSSNSLSNTKNETGSSNSSMNAPKNATGLSNSSMNAPKNTTGLSNSSMNAPKNATGSSNSSMNVPMNATRSSNSSINAPKNATGSSNSSMNTAKNATGSSNSLSNTKNETGSSNSSMNAPKNTTGSSNNSMNAPKNATGLSNNSMNAPKNATGLPNSSMNAQKNTTGLSNSSMNEPKNTTGLPNSSTTATGLSNSSAGGPTNPIGQPISPPSTTPINASDSPKTTTNAPSATVSTSPPDSPQKSTSASTCATSTQHCITEKKKKNTTRHTVLPVFFTRVPQNSSLPTVENTSTCSTHHRRLPHFKHTTVFEESTTTTREPRVLPYKKKKHPSTDCKHRKTQKTKSTQCTAPYVPSTNFRRTGSTTMKNEGTSEGASTASSNTSTTFSHSLLKPKSWSSNDLLLGKSRSHFENTSPEPAHPKVVTRTRLDSPDEVVEEDVEKSEKDKSSGREGEGDEKGVGTFKGKLGKYKNRIMNKGKTGDLAVDNDDDKRKSGSKEGKKGNVEEDGKKEDDEKKTTKAKISKEDPNKNRSESKPGPDGDCNPDEADCVCSMSAMLRDLTALAADDHSDFLAAVQRYQCSRHERKQRTFMITDEVPRSKRGTMEVRPERAIAGKTRQPADTRSTDQHKFVTVGTDVELTCLTIEQMLKIGSNIQTFSWTDAKGYTLTAGHFRESLDGRLAIQHVGIKDEGVYTCWVTYSNPETDEETQRGFDHLLTVVGLPKYFTRVKMNYNVSTSCDTEDVEVWNMFMPGLMRHWFCGDQSSACSVGVDHPMCFNTESGNHLIVNLVVHIPDVFRLLHPPVDEAVCNFRCRVGVQNKFVHLMHSNLVKIVNTPILCRLSYHPVDYNPLTDTVIASLMEGCEGGMRLQDNLCSACPVDSFSPDESAECIKCEIGTYQPDRGTTQCLQCPNVFSGKNCFSLSEAKYLIIAMSIVLIAVTASLTLLICMCCQRKKKCTVVFDGEDMRVLTMSQSGREAFRDAILMSEIEESEKELHSSSKHGDKPKKLSKDSKATVKGQGIGSKHSSNLQEVRVLLSHNKNQSSSSVQPKSSQGSHHTVRRKSKSGPPPPAADYQV